MIIFKIWTIKPSIIRNGKIIFQYKEIYDIDLIEDHGATVGVEAPDKNSGTQYLFNYSYLD